MNRVERARRILLRGNFLTADDLTQKQYELVTNPQTKESVILALHDALTGGHLNNRVQNSLDDGPFTCFDETQIEEGFSDDGEEPESEGFTEPVAPLSLTPAPV